MSELLEFILNHEEAFKSNARLTSLYSDFATLKQTNPDGYRANISAWRSVLERAGREGVLGSNGMLTFKAGSELASRLECRSPALGRPLGLDEVVADSISSGNVIPLTEYMNATSSIYRKSWMSMVPSTGDVARWILEQIGLGRRSGTQGEFVLIKNLEEASQKILTHISTLPQTSPNLVYSLETFTNNFSNVLRTPSHPDLKLSTPDIRILLTYLSRDKLAASVRSPTSSDENNTTVIRFAPVNSTQPPQPITQADTTIATLHTLSTRLTAQASALTSRISHLDVLVRKAVADKAQRDTALRHLRSKKQAQATLSNRTSQLAQIEDTLASIEEAEGQVDMVRAMDASAQVLRDLNKKVGGADGAEKVMDNLADARADTDDIGKVINQDMEGAVAVDEDEVDDELEALEREVGGKAKEKEKANEPLPPQKEEQKQEQEQPSKTSDQQQQFPDVPTTDPGPEASAEESANQNDTPMREAEAETETTVKDSSELTEKKEVEVQKRMRGLSLEEEESAPATVESSARIAPEQQPQIQPQSQSQSQSQSPPEQVGSGEEREQTQRAQETTAS
ncbi:MAG: hypothetical protein M1831_007086 [Alyxoria varia]|nr:MAG: hypothetical protein M1831_007086 [Alyxoria varia]